MNTGTHTQRQGDSIYTNLPLTGILLKILTVLMKWLLWTTATQQESKNSITVRK